MDQTESYKKWAPPSSLSDIGATPRVRFTPPPPPPEPAYAPLRTRAKALAIDAAPALVVVISLAVLSDGISSANGFLRIKLSAPPLLLSMVLWIAYMTLMEAKYGASMGKRMMGLVVVNEEDGSPVELEAALIRNALRFLDAVPYVVPYLLGYIVADRSPHRQRFGDRVAETIVITRESAVQAGGPATYRPSA